MGTQMSKIRWSAHLLTAYYTALTWIPTAVIILPPNNWYWLIAKTLAGLILLGTVLNFLRDPVLVGYIGSASWGFVINAALFGAMLFWPTFWIQVLLALLIVSGLLTCRNIIEKIFLKSRDEPDQIANYIEK